MNNEIFILPGNTDLNRGDQALVWETIEVLKDVDRDAKFILFESGTNAQDAFLQSRQTRNLGFEIVPKILRHPSRIKATGGDVKEAIGHSFKVKISWGFRALLDLLSSAMLLSRFEVVNNIGKLFLSRAQKQSLFRLSNARAVVVKGGGFIHAYGKLTDFYTMYFSLFHIKLAQRYGKKVIIFPNSIGPINGVFTKGFVVPVLRKAELVTVREQVSKEYLQNKLSLHTQLFPDLGFFLQSKKPDEAAEYFRRKGIPVDTKKLVGITLRPYRFPNSENPELSYGNYVNEIVSFVSQLDATNYHVVFFAHTLGPSAHEDDRLALNDVIKKLDSGTRAKFSYLEDLEHDCRDLQDLYSQLDVMVGTRFHSVIFALNSLIPCIAIAYGGNKSFGIMNDMTLGDFVFPIEKFSASQLMTAYKNIDDNRKLYQQRIADYKVYLSQKRDELVNVVSAVLN